MNFKKYKNKSNGEIILASKGYSSPLNQRDPIVEGFWIPLDLNGSIKFIPRPEFEKTFTEFREKENP